MEVRGESYLLTFEEIEKIFNYGKLSACRDRELKEDQVERLVKSEWL